MPDEGEGEEILIHVCLICHHISWRLIYYDKEKKKGGGCLQHLIRGKLKRSFVACQHVRLYFRRHSYYF